MNQKQPVVLLNAAITNAPPADLELVTATLQQLYETDLGDVIEALAMRVLGPTADTPAGDARDAQLVDGGGGLRDCPRLLLLDLQWVASVPGWTPAMRTERALEAIGLCGF